MTINLTPDHFAYFPSKCGLVDEDFPTPVIQLEIQGNIPWVLNEPDPAGSGLRHGQAVIR